MAAINPLLRAYVLEGAILMGNRRADGGLSLAGM
jgi:hypothetical protein